MEIEARRSIRARRWTRPGVVLLVLALSAPAAAETGTVETLRVRAGESTERATSALSTSDIYGVLVSVPMPAQLDADARLDVIIEDAAGLAASKRLHPGDTDMYVTLRPRRDGPGRIRVECNGDAGRTCTLSYNVQRLPLSGRGEVLVAAGPNATWQTAQPIELGKTVYAANDERPYIPADDGPEKVLAAMLAGAQWYTFEHTDQKPVLVHVMLEVLDRDIPCDVTLFRLETKDGQSRVVPYEEGVERYIIEQSTTFHGLNKMIARVLRPGTYYLRVMGNHPACQIRTNLYEPPPYWTPAEQTQIAGAQAREGQSTRPAAQSAASAGSRERDREAAARKAIRVAMDYMVNKGDSWHANTPRKGGIVLRTSNALQETQLCIACHPTHFTTRSQMVAVENGWPVRQRSALKFLTERLYNNPRPLYGAPDAAWVRVISAPGNVTSRLAYMEMEFEKYITGERRENLMGDMANLLEQYWSGMTRVTDESTGNLPRVSGFEIALHSRYVFDEMHRRTSDPKYITLRDQAEQVARESDCIDVMDLCWKAVALASADRSRYAKEISELIERIFSYQKPDGTWSMVFGDKIMGYDYYAKKHTESKAPLDADGTPKASEFQTYHCLYALARCGVTTQDPRLVKTLDWCLSRQWPNGAWQGNADFKNFDTTFRETQYALMALSELYKGPGSKGWYAGFAPPPEKIPADDVDAVLARLEQYWEKPGERTLEEIRAALNHPQVLVREAAAACLGRVADADSLPALIERLGDPSKLVQRSAAWAVREIITRRNAGHERLLAALRSEDERARWGALRVFNQHFRYLAPSEPLLDEVIQRMHQDPAPANRMAAAQSLARWWFWLKQSERQQRIEAAFLAALARPEHPWVRRNLIEGLRNIMDDNTRYLYNTWIPALKDPQDRQRVERGHQQHVSAQAARIGKVLVEGNDLQRDGILRSFYTFHLQEPGGDVQRVAGVALPETYVHPEPVERGQNKWIDGYRAAATYDPLTMGTGSVARLGNDSEPPDFRGDAAGLIAQSLRSVLERDPASGLAAVKTVRHLRTLPLDDALSAALLRLALSAAPEQADEIHQMLGDLLPARMASGEPVLAPLAELVARGKGGALRLAGRILTTAGRSELANGALVSQALLDRLAQAAPDDPDLAALLDAATQITAVAGDQRCVSRVFALAESGPPQLREPAWRMMLRSQALLAAGEPRKRFERMLRQAGAEEMKLLLGLAGRLDVAKKEADLTAGLVLGVITTGLMHADDSVRTAAVEAVRSVPAMQDNPGVVARLRQIESGHLGASSGNARTLLASISARSAPGKKDAAELLDFDFFAQKVQPVLAAPGEDRFACVSCHANHSIFKLNEPDVEGRLTDAQLRENYLHALRVVDLSKPENSLLLKKPTSPFDGIGVPGAYARTHGGDVRWAGGSQSEEYRTILRWLQGARTAASSRPAANAQAGR